MTSNVNVERELEIVSKSDTKDIDDFNVGESDEEVP